MNYRTLYNHHNILVDQGFGQRRLFLNGTCMGRSEATKPSKPLSEYIIKICDYIELKKFPNVLLIGGGAYLIPTNSPNSRFTIVEPSREITDIATRYFGFKPWEHTLIFSIMEYVDLKFLNLFDCIILDAYSGNKPVPELYNEVFYTKCVERLTKDGVLIVNDTSSGDNVIWLRNKSEPLKSVRL